MKNINIKSKLIFMKIIKINKHNRKLWMNVKYYS